MPSYLPIYKRSGAIGVPTNVNGRIDVYEGVTTYEITNSPDETPEDGGKFPVFDGATVYLCDFIVQAGPGGGFETGAGAPVQSRGHMSTPRGGVIYGL